MTRFLPNGQAIKREVRRIFKEEKGRRVAVVAFVGQNADAYLPKPRGLELVCWPKPPGTNPKAIDTLIDRKVDVYFADRLHMKVYWTQSKGAVVASANLSTNAYGAGSLHEAGALLPSSAINIDAVLHAIKPEPVNKQNLKKLRTAWLAARRKQKRGGGKPHTRTFLDWLSASERTRWLAFYFEHIGGGASQRLRAVAKEETGNSKVEDWIYCRKGELGSEDFVLLINLASKRKPIINRWFFTHRVVLVSSGDKRYNRSFPFQAGQLYSNNACPRHPFDIDAPLRKAFRAAYKELQGDGSDFSVDKTGPPSKRLLQLLEKYYRAYGGK